MGTYVRQHAWCTASSMSMRFVTGKKINTTTIEKFMRGVGKMASESGLIKAGTINQRP
jgi:hypothetical protein